MYSLQNRIEKRTRWSCMAVSTWVTHFKYWDLLWCEGFLFNSFVERLPVHPVFQCRSFGIKPDKATLGTRTSDGVLLNLYNFKLFAGKPFGMISLFTNRLFGLFGPRICYSLLKGKICFAAFGSVFGELSRCFRANYDCSLWICSWRITMQCLWQLLQTQPECRERWVVGRQLIRSHNFCVFSIFSSWEYKNSLLSLAQMVFHDLDAATDLIPISFITFLLQFVVCILSSSVLYVNVSILNQGLRSI